MATTSKKSAASKAPAKTGSPKPAKSRIVPGLYQGRLLIAPDFFESHETPPGLVRLMPTSLTCLSDPRVLLTEVGEQQWLDQVLDDAAAQQSIADSDKGRRKRTKEKKLRK